jgi:hypothetical protein
MRLFNFRHKMEIRCNHLMGSILRLEYFCNSQNCFSYT